MKLEFLNFPTFLVVCFLAPGVFLSFSTVAKPEMEEDERMQKPPSESHKSQQSSDGPLGPLQRALDKNNRHLQQKVQNSMSENPAQNQDTMKPSMSASPAPAGGMASGGMMGMMSEMMGKMMPQMPAAPAAMQSSRPPSSELPGLPGASHIYHIGATGFFVDHADMVNFKPAQLTSLNQIKEQSLLAQSSFKRKIQLVEEELWTLTASDRLNIKKIEAKLRESESLKVEKRISFIRYVGEAANVLTPEQRSILLGKAATKPPSQAADVMKEPGSSMPQDKSSPPMDDM